MSGHAVTAWLFGKMPTHGDFVARGLTPEQRDRLDLWLSDEMTRARDALGTDFDAAFGTAPPWLLAARDDEAGGWFGGALCPSVDAVGRRFPLFLARRVEGSLQAAAAARRCEDAIYRAFDEGLDADALHAAVIDEGEVADAPPVEGWWTEGNDAFPPARLAGPYPAGLVTMMLREFADG